MSMPKTISEQLVIDPLTLKVLADPSRSYLVYSLAECAKPAKQLAVEMDCPITRLYYHLQQLQKHGLIFVERTQKVSGIIEKHYRASAREFVIDRSAYGAAGQIDNVRSQALLGFVFDQTRLDISNGLNSGRIDARKPPPEVGSLMAYRTIMKLSPAQAKGLYDKLLAVYLEYEAIAKAPEAEGDFYALVASVYPTMLQNPGSQQSTKPRIRSKNPD
jgi:hypothetical protein